MLAVCHLSVGKGIKVLVGTVVEMCDKAFGGKTSVLSAGCVGIITGEVLDMFTNLPGAHWLCSICDKVSAKLFDLENIFYTVCYTA